MAEIIDDPTLKAIVKWRNHPSIPAVASDYKNRANFSFDFVSEEDVPTEIKMLDVSKAIQESDIPIDIIKANENFFAEAICFYFNKSLENGKFPNYKLINVRTMTFNIVTVKLFFRYAGHRRLYHNFCSYSFSLFKNNTKPLINILPCAFFIFYDT